MDAADVALLHRARSPRPIQTPLTCALDESSSALARGILGRGSTARQLSTLRRIVPSRAFDSQIRKFNRLAA
jgi:hypothetical protein